MLTPADIPSPIDLQSLEDAREWAATALTKRPWRTELFARFAQEIRRIFGNAPVRLLELGSGPGFLAEHLLNALPILDYTALDFSETMHDLARERLGSLASRVQLIQRSFKDSDWGAGLGSFDVVVTLQAVHELRHKRYAAALHAQVRTLLKPHSVYLMADHFVGEGGFTNNELYMTVDEQSAALREGGFATPELLAQIGSVAMHRAVR